MSRKFDHSRQVHEAALEVLKGSVRPKPRWCPKFIWHPYQLAAKIVLK